MTTSSTPQQTNRSSRRGLLDSASLALIFLTYVLAVVFQGYQVRDRLNPDGVAYLRNAEYIIEGRFQDSISGYWSPLLSWSIAALRLTGIEGVYCARIAIAIWGGVALLGSFLLLRALSGRVRITGAAALTIIAVDFAVFSMLHITPDILMAGLLLVYCAVAASHRIVERRSSLFVAGLLGGVAFLAKSYALPFFLVHFSLTLLHHFISDRTRRSISKLACGWFLGMLGFALIAGPWIGLLSIKHGKLTFSTVARVAHTIAGPNDIDRSHSWNRELYPVPEGRLTIWETPEETIYHEWSPLESRAYLMHQIRHTLRTSAAMLQHISAFDVLSMSLVCLTFMPLLLTQPGNRPRGRLAVWTLGTVGIFAGGFTLLYWEARYTHSFLFPVCCLFCLGLSARAIGRAWRRIGVNLFAIRIAATLAILSFTVAMLARYALMEQRADHVIDYRSWAGQLRSADIGGPIATLDTEHPARALYLSYFLDVPFVGTAQSAPVEAVEAALRSARARTLIVPGGEEFRWFRDHSRWRLAYTLKSAQGALDVFVDE